MNHQIQMIVHPDRKERTEYTVDIDGLFMYRDHRSFSDSVKSFVEEYAEEKHDFNECYGAYRFSITQKETGESVRFADNSGLMRFYINQASNLFARSLAEASPMEKRSPNYSAIAQFLCYGCIYSEETIIESVVFSNPEMYYIIKDNKIIKKNKHLKALSEYGDERLSLQSLVNKAADHWP